MTTTDTPPGRSWLLSRSGLVLLGFLIVAGFFLLTEHTAHVFGVLPYLLVLACPLLHLFHGRHGGHGRPGADDGRHDSAGRHGQSAGGNGRSS
jgi:hypothetical protein